MSRLDWFTILIVGVCIIALGFLVYKTVQLMGDEKATLPRTEISQTDNRKAADPAIDEGSGQTDNTPVPGADDQDLDDDELTYDPQEVETPEEKTTAPAPEPAAPKTPAKAKKEEPSSTSSQAKPQPIASSNTDVKGGTPTNYSSASGNFMVVAGSFSQRINAESQVKHLKSLGYGNARVEIFNGGNLATALVDRFTDYNAAKQLANELKGKGVDAFVKKKQ